MNTFHDLLPILEFIAFIAAMIYLGSVLLGALNNSIDRVSEPDEHENQAVG